MDRSTKINMPVESAIQAKFERNLTWKRSWPRCFLALIATVEILLALAILVTEIFNILVDFWHSNVFGGVWASIILLINWILIFVTVCCATTIRASTCSFVWNFITLVALAVLIVFDAIFIINPYTCILTPTCSSQSQLVSVNSVVQSISQFQSYSIYDSKKLFLEVQVGCAGLAFIICIIYMVIFLICRLKFRKRAITDNPIAAIVPPKHGLRIARGPAAPFRKRSDVYPSAPY